MAVARNYEFLCDAMSQKRNLEKPIVGPDGTKWFFQLNCDFIEGAFVERLFFWDEQKEVTGLIEWRGDATLHMKRVKDRMRRIAKDAEYRSRFLKPLEFPLKRNW